MSLQNATGAEERAFTSRLVAFNALQAGPELVHKFSLVLKDSEGQVVGGISAARSWSTLVIDVLWVEDDQRGTGYGTLLLKAAEDRGRTLGCNLATLETFSFQAEEFYIRRGYSVVGRVPGWPPGGHLSRLAKKIRD